MKPIDSARQIAAQRVGAVQPAARSPASASQTSTGAPQNAPAAVVASIAAQLSAAQEPPVDMERVDAIRAALRRGEYSLEPGEIADAMIAGGHLKRDSE